MKKLKTISLQSKVFFLLGFLVFIWVIINVNFKRYSKYLGDETNVTVKIIDYIQKDNKITIEAYGKEKILIIYYLSDNNVADMIFNIGDTVTFSGNLSIPYNNTVPNNFNYKEYLYNNEIYYLFEADSFEIIKSNTNTLYFLKSALKNYIHTFEYSEYFSLLILGDKSGLNDLVYESYKNNGIAHLLAISGLHISVFILIFEYLLKKVNYKVSVVVIFLFLLFYLFLTNFAVSVYRCFLVFTLNKLKDLFVLSLGNFQILLIVFYFMLIFNPFLVFNVGFQYSFIICFSLLVANINKKSYISNLFKISLVSFFASLPITVMNNYEINLLAVISNLFFVPLMSFLIYPFSLIVLVFPLLEFVFNALIIFFECGSSLFDKYFSFIVIVPKISFVFYYIYYVLLFYFLKFDNKKIYFLLSIIIFAKLIIKFNNEYQIYFLDVGQGDATLLISPYKEEVILIDTGGNSNYNVSKNYIILLKSLGISKIDLLIVTHGDFDHIGDFKYLYGNFNVENVIINNNEINEHEKIVIDSGVSVLNNYNFKYFNCLNINSYTSSDENNSSLVYYCAIYNYNFLFAGDVGKDVMHEILNVYSVNVDFLKVSHHGSKNDTDDLIVESTSPDVAFISAGRNNLYNHPNVEVMEILDRFNVEYYRTDENGTILLKINKKMYNILTYEP